MRAVCLLLVTVGLCRGMYKEGNVRSPRAPPPVEIFGQDGRPISGETIYPPTGSTLLLACRIFPPHTDSLMMWATGEPTRYKVLNSTERPDKFTITRGFDYFNLSIHNVSFWDDEKYHCKVVKQNNAEDIFYVDTVRVEAVGPPEVLVTPENLTMNVPLGDDLSLTCPFVARPRVNVTWTHRPSGTGPSVVLSTRPPVDKIEASSETSIYLTNVTDSRLGLYTCHLENSLGRASATFHVKGDPFLSVSAKKGQGSPTRDVTVSPGDTMELRCNAFNFPQPPQLRWFHAGPNGSRSDVMPGSAIAREVSIRPLSGNVAGGHIRFSTSMLTLTGVTRQARGTLGCAAAFNRYLEDFVTVELEGPYAQVCSPGGQACGELETCTALQLCVCQKGYQRNQFGTCVDVDECAVDNGQCQHFCVNEVGSYDCHCPEDLVLAPDKKNCLPPMKGKEDHVGLIVGVVAATSLTVIGVVLVLIVFFRCRKNKKRDSIKQKILASVSLNSLGSGIAQDKPTRASLLPSDEFPRSRLSILEPLGQGHFGSVHKALALNIRGSGTWETVAVKMLNEGAGHTARQEFLKEMMVLRSLPSHRHVVSYLGCCSISDPVVMVMELVAGSDLLALLRRHRPRSVLERTDSDTHALPSEAMTSHPPADGDVAVYDASRQQGHLPSNHSPSIQSNTFAPLYSADSFIHRYAGRSSGTPLLNPTYYGALPLGFRNPGFQGEGEGVPGVNAYGYTTPYFMPPLPPEQTVELEMTGPRLLSFALQIAKGMEHLARHKIIHRDLAARNVLVDQATWECKISDFGLARDLGSRDDYERSTQVPLPIRWMAPESLVEGRHTSQSDVWSFGIVLWEIVTLGASPYCTMTKREVIESIMAGKRMDKPPHCEEALYNIMMRCWEERPEARPEFSTLVTSLDAMLEERADYIKLEEYCRSDYLVLQRSNEGSETI